MATDLGPAPGGGHDLRRRGDADAARCRAARAADADRPPLVPAAPGGEWTVEANPGTLDAGKADVLAEAGVDRISLGAQSFRPDSLRVLERDHGREEVERAVDDRPRPIPAVVARPDLRRARLIARRLGADLEIAHRASARRISRATAWSTRRARALEAGERGEVRPLDEELEAVDVRGHDRSARPGGPGDVRDLELRPAGRRVAAQPGLLGERGVFRLRRRRGALRPRASDRSTPASCRRTSAGSRPASPRPGRPRS